MRSITLASFMLCVSGLLAACEGDGPGPQEAATPVTRANPGASAKTAPSVTPIASAPNPAASATAAAPDEVVPLASATESPAPTTEPSRITITLGRFDCSAYQFEVRSQPEALYKVHWTATSPADPELANSVTDSEVSQSPGEHTFDHGADDWAQPGSNRLRITAWDTTGASFEETRDIDC